MSAWEVVDDCEVDGGVGVVVSWEVKLETRTLGIRTSVGCVTVTVGDEVGAVGACVGTGSGFMCVEVSVWSFWP